MIALRAPMDGKLLSKDEIRGQNHAFLAPFADFFQNEAPLCHMILLPKDGALRAPLSGILALCDPHGLRFAVCGRARVALWLHSADGTALPLANGDFLSLAGAGAPLTTGQILGWLDLAALHRRGCDPRLSLLFHTAQGGFIGRSDASVEE